MTSAKNAARSPTIRTREGRANAAAMKGADGQEADQGDVPPVDGEDDRHGRHPQERHERRHRLGAVGAVRLWRGLKLLFAWFRHALSRSTAAGSSPKRYSAPPAAGGTFPLVHRGCAPCFLPVCDAGETPEV